MEQQGLQSIAAAPKKPRSAKRRVLYYLDCPCAGGANLLILYLVREIYLADQWDVCLVYRYNPVFSPLLDRILPQSIPRSCAPFPERVEWIDRLDGTSRAALRALPAGRLFVCWTRPFPLEFAFLWIPLSAAAGYHPSTTVAIQARSAVRCCPRPRGRHPAL